MAVKAAGRAALGLMTPHTLQMQGALEARLINMIQVIAAVTGTSFAGLFFVMTSGTGYIVCSFRIGMASDTGIVSCTVPCCVVMTGCTGIHVRMHQS